MSQKYCLVRVDKYICAFDISEIQEVVAQQPVRRVPLSPSVVRGLINLRGHLVLFVNTAAALSLTRTSPDAEEPTNVIVNVEGERLSLLVDEVIEIVEVGPSQVEPAPTTVAPRLRSMLAGTFDWNGNLVLIVDLLRLAESIADTVCRNTTEVVVDGATTLASASTNH